MLQHNISKYGRFASLWRDTAIVPNRTMKNRIAIFKTFLFSLRQRSRTFIKITRQNSSVKLDAVSSGAVSLKSVLFIFCDLKIILPDDFEKFKTVLESADLSFAILAAAVVDWKFNYLQSLLNRA